MVIDWYVRLAWRDPPRIIKRRFQGFSNTRLSPWQGAIHLQQQIEGRKERKKIFCWICSDAKTRTIEKIKEPFRVGKFDWPSIRQEYSQFQSKALNWNLHFVQIRSGRKDSIHSEFEWTPMKNKRTDQKRSLSENERWAVAVRLCVETIDDAGGKTEDRWQRKKLDPLRPKNKQKDRFALTCLVLCAERRRILSRKERFHWSAILSLLGAASAQATTHRVPTQQSAYSTDQRWTDSKRIWD